MTIEALAASYAEVLHINVNDIDSDSSFAALGGDSFDAIKVCQKCAERGLHVTFQQIICRPLRDVAALVSFDGKSPGYNVGGTRCDIQHHALFKLLPKDYDLSRIQEALSTRLGMNLGHVEDIYPCSTMQDNMLIGQKIYSSRLYKEKVLFEIPSWLGSLDSIKAAWEYILQRHQTLRTIYTEATCDPVESERLGDAVVLRSLPPVMKRERCCWHPECLNIRDNNEEDTCDEGYGIAETGAESSKNLTMMAATAAAHLNQMTVYSCCKSRAGDATVVQLVLNHMTVDAYSLTILLSELNAHLQGHAITPVKRPKYADYITYLMHGVEDTQDLDYWTDYLDGVEYCHLSTRSALLTHNQHCHENDEGSSAIAEVPLDGLSVMQSLRTLCRQTNSTIFNAIQAAWAIVLHMYLGAPSEVCFGYIASGRDLPIPGGTAGLVGPMINLLVCRVKDVKEKSLAQLMSSLRDDFQNALPHQCCSLRKVQRILGSTGGKMFNTIVTCFSSPSVGAEDHQSSSLGAIKLLESHNASDFDVVLKVIYSATAIRIRLAYSKTAFAESTAQDLCRNFGAVLERIISRRPSQLEVRAAELGTASPYNLDRIKSWNNQTLSAPHPPPACVHSLIEETIRRAPHAPAVYSWDGELDYQTLSRLSTFLARRICRLLGSGRTGAIIIPVCFEKSKWYPVAILGILKSGNAFCPIDLSNPESRVARIARRLEPYSSGLVICSQKQRHRFTGIGECTLVVDEWLLQDMDRFSLPSRSSGLPNPLGSPDDTAYVIFTSGSTGEPKGVVVSHKAYAFAARAHSSSILLRADSRVLQFASYGFDTSIEDHLTTLCVGACLCVPSEEDRLNIGGSPEDGLAGFVVRSGANWAHLTPSVAGLLAAARFPSLKTMVLGGEPVTSGNIQEWGHSSSPFDTRLVQVYGPSECCVTTTTGPVLGGSSSNSSNSQPISEPTSNIGKPLPGCAAWIVSPDDPNVLSPVGAVGELVVEGPILAEGYLEELLPSSAGEEKSSISSYSISSCSAFVKGLSWAPEKRLYRTGDLVRYGHDGNIHFVGRKGDQVKVHGQRVDIGEVQEALAQTRLSQFAIIVPDGGPGAGRLVAIICPVLTETSSTYSNISTTNDINSIKNNRIWRPVLMQEGWAGIIQSIRDSLLDHLPTYMVPELWLVVSERLPTTGSSAKLDRRKMQNYLRDLTPEDYRYLLTRMSSSSSSSSMLKDQRQGTEAELVMRQVWSHVLGIPEFQISWSSSFFYLGGDSVSAMTVSSMARERGLQVTVADIMRHRTLERLMGMEPRHQPKELPYGPPQSLYPSSSPPSPLPLSSVSSLGETAATDNMLDVINKASPQESAPFKLSPVQQLHFLAAPGGDSLNQQTMVVKITRPIDHGQLVDGLTALLRAHPMLRARFSATPSTLGLLCPKFAVSWQQRFEPTESLDRAAARFGGFRIRFHSQNRPKDIWYVTECIKDAKCAIDIIKGPLVAVDLFNGTSEAKTEEQQGLMSITIHHLVVDAVSWRILLDQLENWLTTGRQIPPESTSFRDHCVTTHLQEQNVPTEQLPESFLMGSALAQRWQMSDMPNTFGTVEKRKVGFGLAETRDLLSMCESVECDLADALCAAVIHTFIVTFKRPPALWAEVHGRDGFNKTKSDFSDTVGWFTTFCPIAISLTQPQSTSSVAPSRSHKILLKEVGRLRRDGRLRRIFPSHMALAASSSLRHDEPKKDGDCALLPHLPMMEVVVNHLGAFQQTERLGSLFRRCPEMLQTSISQLRQEQRKTSNRHSLISILSVLQDGKLSVEMEWSKNMCCQSELLDWASLLDDWLRSGSPDEPWMMDHVRDSSLVAATSCPQQSLPTTIDIDTNNLQRMLLSLEENCGLGRDILEAIYPCSPLQESLMLSQMRASQNQKLYHQGFLFQIYPINNNIRVDPTKLADAWLAVTAKHAILRTVFYQENEGTGAFYQVVLRPGFFTPQIEINELEDDSETGLSALWALRDRNVKASLADAADVCTSTCSPSNGRLLHHALEIYITSAGAVYCLLRKNHLLTDAATSRILIHDFLAIAASLCDPASRAAHQLETSSQVSFAEYIAFVCRQREQLGVSTQYWANFLEGSTACHFPSSCSNIPATTIPTTYNKRTCSLFFDNNNRRNKDAEEYVDGDLLSRACHRHGLTASVIFQAAWALTLRAFLNRADVLFGILVSGRDAPVQGALHIAGPMAVVLPARARIHDTTSEESLSSPTLLQLARDLQANYLNHLDHQHVPLAAIQHTAPGSSSTGGQHLFNTILNVQAVGSRGPLRRGGEDQSVDSGVLGGKLLHVHDASEFDIALSVSCETNEFFGVTIEYPNSFMTTQKADSIIEAFKTAVMALVNNPSAEVAATSLLSKSEETLLRSWNSSNRLEVNDRCVHELVQETCARRSSHPAICSWDGNLTFLELDKLSASLAHTIISLFGGHSRAAGAVVALIFEKSMWAVVAMLAVARTGAAFVHIDPDGPRNRAKTMLEKTRATLCLTSPLQMCRQDMFSPLTLFIMDESVTVLAVDRSVVKLNPGGGESEGAATAASLPSVRPSSTFYIIFTSGSTGVPKGVVVPHKSFCSAVAANLSSFEMTSHSRVLQFAHYSFDESLEETFHALVAGACVCIPSDEERLADLPDFIHRIGVTWAALTPSFLRTLQPGDTRLRSLEFITVEGEPMTQALVDMWTTGSGSSAPDRPVTELQEDARGRRPRIKASYGPTECSVTSTISKPFTADSDAANIGWPLGCRAWVVDPKNYHTLLPIGAIGELLIDGPIVSTGYLDDAVQTDQSFVLPPAWSSRFIIDNDDWSTNQLRRLYKTGDLVCHADDGSLLFVGRRQDQSLFKIRGQRVELGEIQANLDRLTQIRHSIVVVPPSGLLVNRLVAVVALAAAPAGCREEETSTTCSSSEYPKLVSDDAMKSSLSLEEMTVGDLAAVRSGLAAVLPHYMLPEAWLVLDQVPMQPSLKLDRQKVLSLVQGLDQASVDAGLRLANSTNGRWPTTTDDDDQDAASSEREVEIRSIWARVLGLAPEQVSIHQPFFSLGGDSIHAIKAAQSCRAAKVQCTLKDIMANPTVRQLACVIDAR
ncbi:nonribosomal peptide [Colletotrichum incanum]|uniref:Nonribosomal peptide n=1 Tax=Colletotrichum incanum TaxID=1573173 RepID=A0A167BCV3_COLIC|nr:nonribosomal peptide [Colletotrichum incanum]OHW95272.1 nonribosomal peptide synthase [Colletotrichum incanum]